MAASTDAGTGRGAGSGVGVSNVRVGLPIYDCTALDRKALRRESGNVCGRLMEGAVWVSGKEMLVVICGGGEGDGGVSSATSSGTASAAMDGTLFLRTSNDVLLRFLRPSSVVLEACEEAEDMADEALVLRLKRGRNLERKSAILITAADQCYVSQLKLPTEDVSSSSTLHNKNVSSVK